jgi:hypothetical protein
VVPTELKEELRGTWGPAPVDPEPRVQWEEDMELMAQVPTLLAKKVINEGTLYPSLRRDYGSLEQLSTLQAQCIERYLTQRIDETLHDVVVETTEKLPWSRLIEELSPVQKSRLRSRLLKDLENNLTLVLVSLGHTGVIGRLFGLR